MSAPWSAGNAATVTKMNNPSGRLSGSAASLRAGFGGVIYNTAGGAGNVGAGETDLWNQSVAANVLSTDGYYLDICAWIFFAANANNKRVRAYFGSTVFFDSGAIGWNGVWARLQAQIFRTGAATQTAFATLLASGATSPVLVSEAGPAETLSGAVTFRYTGTAVSNNDIIGTQARILWYPPADT